MDGVIETASGLQYRVIKEGTGATPGPHDFVRVNYTGYHMDGTEFDSSEKRGGTARFQVNQIIPGWNEMLQLMKEGEQVVVYVPPDLGYGDRKVGDNIEPGSTLIFKIELLEVVKNNNEPK